MPTSTTLLASLRAARGLLVHLYRTPQSALGSTIVVLFVLVALFGAQLAPFSANDQRSQPRLPPNSAGHPFGTDYLGRDVYSRVILGANNVLLTAGLGTAIAVALGTALGLTIGYLGGWVDEAASRVIDALLALPALLVALVILGVVKSLSLEPNTFAAAVADQSVLLTISFVYTPLVARVIRSTTLEIKTREFVEAARLGGESTGHILTREIFPSVVPALVVEAALRFSYAIFLVAALGFLGLGAAPPSPDWGLMVQENRGGLYTQTPWALHYPAIAIAVLVVGVNLMSDGIRRAVQRNA
jgi:peptide/nickel transport system permease protein